MPEVQTQAAESRFLRPRGDADMTTLQLRRNPGVTLSAADDASAEALQRWKVGDLLFAEVRKPRNPAFHRKFFALLGYAFDCQETYTDRETFRQAVLLMAQVVDLVPTPDGGVKPVPRSLSFSAMDDVAFSRVYQQCLTAICDHFVQGQDAAEMDGVVQSILDGFA